MRSTGSADYRHGHAAMALPSMRLYQNQRRTFWAFDLRKLTQYFPDHDRRALHKQTLVELINFSRYSYWDSSIYWMTVTQCSCQHDKYVCDTWRQQLKKVEELDQFIYLGSTQKEIKVTLAQALSAMTKLAVLWKNKAISSHAKIKLYKSLVSSTLLLYGCENGTLTADLLRRI